MEHQGPGTTGQRTRSPRGRMRIQGRGEEETVFIFIVGKESVSSALSGTRESGEEPDKRLMDLLHLSHTHGFTHTKATHKMAGVYNLCAIFQGKGPWWLTLLPT